ncbi:MAG: heat-inducible transcriptional repressor HrcA [Xanthomonadaceae bacterium]|nr:heat-inducible transcriptional repressor HrcA [Xanthomonadaceae bacterium]
MHRPIDPVLDPRARLLLRSLIARYIRDGEPVGSQTLAKHAGLDVSPATIRNILAELEDVGLLSAPHTSAGRVPTAQGYRLFVDSLLQIQPLADVELAHLRSELAPGAGTQHLLGSASELVSAMTHFVGVVSVPKREQFAFKRLDFVALDAQRVLAVLVFADNEIQNRILITRRTYEPAELERIANYLNAHFAGRPLAEARASLLDELRHARQEMESLMAQALELADQALADDAEDMLVAGQTRLIGMQDLSNLDRLRELFEAFSSKREILRVLERTLRAQGVRIFIGEETGMAPLDGVSLVTAPYGAGGRTLGVLGVIGPTRMAYERVIPVVQAAASALTEALGQDDPRVC